MTIKIPSKLPGRDQLVTNNTLNDQENPQWIPRIDCYCISIAKT